MSTKRVVRLFVCFSLFANLAYAEIITWDFTANDLGITGYLLLDDADPHFLPNAEISDANAIKDAFFTNGAQEWSYSGGDNFGIPVGSTRLQLGPVASDPSGSWIALAARDSVSPAGDNSDLGMNGGNGNISVVTLISGAIEQSFDGTFTLGETVPEPASAALWLLLGAGLIGASYRRFRRDD